MLKAIERNQGVKLYDHLFVFGKVAKEGSACKYYKSFTINPDYVYEDVHYVFGPYCKTSPASLYNELVELLTAEIQKPQTLIRTYKLCLALFYSFEEPIIISKDCKNENQINFSKKIFEFIDKKPILDENEYFDLMDIFEIL